MEQFPGIWGNGGLFAFSGLDGPTSITEPFVLATQTDLPGLGVRWLARTLTFEKRSRLGGVRLAACDCADLDLHLPDGGKTRLRLVFLNKDAVLGRADAIINPVLDGHNPEGGPYLALAGRSDGAHFTFALAHSTQSAAEAEEQARAGLGADFEAAFASRLAFFKGLKLEGVRFPMIPWFQTGSESLTCWTRCSSPTENTCRSLELDELQRARPDGTAPPGARPRAH